MLIYTHVLTIILIADSTKILQIITYGLTLMHKAVDNWYSVKGPCTDNTHLDMQFI